MLRHRRRTTGEYVTVVASYRYRDHKVTENGDGTLTETVQTTQNAVSYNQDGERWMSPSVKGGAPQRRTGVVRDTLFSA